MTTQLETLNYKRLSQPGALVPICSAHLGSWQLALHRRALSHTEIKHSYEAAAPRWQRKTRRCNAASAYRDLLRNVLPPLPANPGVLDCGIGCGALSLALDDVAPGSASLHGIDVSPAMLREARNALAARGRTATLCEGDIEAIPFHADTFDFTIAAHILEHLPDPAEALREITRVTRPGGRVLLCLTRRSLAGLWVHLRWRTRLYTSDAAATLLAEAGITNIQTRTLGRFTVAAWGENPADTERT